VNQKRDQRKVVPFFFSPLFKEAPFSVLFTSHEVLFFSSKETIGVHIAGKVARGPFSF